MSDDAAMSDDRDALRYAARRVSLRAALRDGDALTAARAASRLRVDGFALTSDEFARARQVRRAVGLALVKARMPRPEESPLRHEPAIYSEDRGPRKRLAAALAIIAALLLVLLFGDGVVVPPGGGGGAPPVAVETTRAPILTVSRGRTISLPAEIVVVEESPTPAPTAEPTAEPTASAAPGTARPSATSGSGTGSTGSGTGSGGGNGSGEGSGNGSGTGSGSATPGPSPTLPPLRPGFSRLNFIVYDASTRRTLPDVCIVAGAPNCGPNAPHTNVYGQASVDVAATSASTRWDIIFIKSGYVTQTKSVTLPGGVSRTYLIFLVRSRG